MGKGHDAAKHPKTHGAAHTTKNYPYPNANRLNLRKCCSGPKGLMDSPRSYLYDLNLEEGLNCGHGGSFAVQDPLTRTIYVNFQRISSQQLAYFSFLLLLLCRVCETGSDNQPLSDNQQTTCEYFVDSLFEEAQKIGARCLSPTEQKKQVDVHNFCLFQSFSKYGPFRGSVRSKLFHNDSKILFTLSLC